MFIFLLSPLTRLHAEIAYHITPTCPLPAVYLVFGFHTDNQPCKCEKTNKTSHVSVKRQTTNKWIIYKTHKTKKRKKKRSHCQILNLTCQTPWQDASRKERIHQAKESCRWWCVSNQHRRVYSQDGVWPANVEGCCAHCCGNHEISSRAIPRQNNHFTRWSCDGNSYAEQMMR